MILSLLNYWDARKTTGSLAHYERYGDNTNRSGKCLKGTSQKLAPAVLL